MVRMIAAFWLAGCFAAANAVAAQTGAPPAIRVGESLRMPMPEPAPGVGASLDVELLSDLTGPITIGDISAADSATPVLMTGGSASPAITGGDLLQLNDRALRIGGFSTLQFVEVASFDRGIVERIEIVEYRHGVARPQQPLAHM